MFEMTHRHVRSNGITMHIAEAGEGPLVVLLHGFPELWYSWRHQLPAIASVGYHAVAPDVRGYGETDAPPAVESYSLLNMTADVAGLLDALGEEKAVVVGHDWGANIAWWCMRLFPERFAAVVALGVPYEQQPPASTPMLRQWAGKGFNFALYFQEPGRAERELEADPRRTLRLLFYALSGDAPADLVTTLFTAKPADAGALDGMPDPPALPPWLTEADLDVYTQAFRQSGFRGPLNQYRNLDRNWEELAPFGEVRVEQPVLFIGGELDSAVRFGNVEAMRAALPKLRKVVLLPGCGHWVQQERPAVVNAEITDFLRKEIPPRGG
jgi:pimeloyl-ACP methyl ester carboxylesterase